jgi:hypothetical protein
MSLPREILLGKMPQRALRAEAILLIGKFAAKRYLRAAFPDAFNTRLKPAQAAIQKILKRSGELLEGIYLRLKTDEELAEGTDYTLIMRTTVLSETKADAERFSAAQKATAALISEMNKCSGIVIVEGDCVGEADFTLAHLREFSRWDYDYLTVRQEQRKPAV